MRNFLRNHFAVVVAFSLPILLLLGVAVTSFLPGFFLRTDYDFVYATCEDVTNQNRYYINNNCESYLSKKYTVDAGVITENVVNMADLVRSNTQRENIPRDSDFITRLYLHDTTSNVSREITLQDAATLKISALTTSPDSVSVSEDYSRGGGYLFVFDSYSSDYGYYLKKGNAKKRLNLLADTEKYYSRNNIHFVGWHVQ